jgi:hypothetical protein
LTPRAGVPFPSGEGIRGAVRFLKWAGTDASEFTPGG